jgi:antitoxin component YwqK of YwqJK toxin-antitoxin module
MRNALIIFCLFFLYRQTFAQIDNGTAYKNLETKKFYRVGLHYSRINFWKRLYEVNGRRVSKSTYNKYESTWTNMETCCPCILKSFDEHDVLLTEAVSYTDCGVGWFKYYYPNGNVKLNGQFKENPTKNWKDIAARGFCSVPVGQWTYFNDKGDSLYSEFWEDGKFIKQVPEQNSTQIWKIDFTLHGQKIVDQIVTIQQVKDLIITPHFKNSHKDGVTVNFIIEVAIFVGPVVEQKEVKQSFSLDNFKDIDVTKILSEVGNSAKNTVTTFRLEVCANGEVITMLPLTSNRYRNR